MDTLRKPPWLTKRISLTGTVQEVRTLMRKQSLHTVCESARCPNIGECWSRKTATFLIMGDVCTRNCHYCAIATGRPMFLDPREPERVAEAAANLGLRHVVVTSVARDELKDGGARHFARTIQAIRDKIPGVVVEVLIPDFKGSENALQIVLEARPDILNHNVETIDRLHRKVRPQGDYHRSLTLLGRAKAGMERGYTKSGLMVGLGETPEEVTQVMRDLRGIGCDIFTIGQYLRPTMSHLEVVRYCLPEEFEGWKREGEALGFRFVASGPYVRSSYHADDFKLPESEESISGGAP